MPIGSVCKQWYVGKRLTGSLGKMCAYKMFVCMRIVYCTFYCYEGYEAKTIPLNSM